MWDKEDDGGLCAYPYLLNNCWILPFFLPPKHMHTQLCNIHSCTCTHMHTRARARTHTWTIHTSNSVAAIKGKSVFVAWSSPRYQVPPSPHYHSHPHHYTHSTLQFRNLLFAREGVALKQWKNHPNCNIC